MFVSAYKAEDKTENVKQQIGSDHNINLQQISDRCILPKERNAAMK